MTVAQKTKKPTVPEKHKTKRKITQPKYKSFRAHKRIKHPGSKLLSSLKIFMSSWRHIKAHWKIFGGIGFVYTLLVLVFIRNFAFASGLADTKDLLSELFSEQTGGIFISSVLLFTTLIGSSSQTSGKAGGAFQLIVVIVVSLAVIWALRQTYSGEKPRVRDAFYNGMYPLIPYVITIALIMIQFIPFLVGGFIFSLVVQNGLAVNFEELVLWGSLFFCMALLSLYMLSSSLFASYIVTLPNMTPISALKSARELVRYRRWSVMRKIFLFPMIILIIGFVLFVPVILLMPRLAEVLFLPAALFVLVIAHSYMYKLYRELL